MADSFNVPSPTAFTDRPSWLLGPDETPHERFVDDQNRRTGIDITLTDIASRNQPHAICLEPSGRHGIDPRCLLLPGEDRPAGHLNAVVPPCPLIGVMNERDACETPGTLAAA